MSTATPKMTPTNVVDKITEKLDELKKNVYTKMENKELNDMFATVNSDFDATKSEELLTKEEEKIKKVTELVTKFNTDTVRTVKDAIMEYKESLPITHDYMTSKKPTIEKYISNNKKKEYDALITQSTILDAYSKSAKVDDKLNTKIFTEITELYFSTIHGLIDSFSGEDITDEGIKKKLEEEIRKILAGSLKDSISASIDANSDKFTPVIKEMVTDYVTDKAGGFLAYDANGINLAEINKSMKDALTNFNAAITTTNIITDDGNNPLTVLKKGIDEVFKDTVDSAPAPVTGTGTGGSLKSKSRSKSNKKSKSSKCKTKKVASSKKKKINFIK